LEHRNVKTLLETATARLANAGCDTPGLDAEVLLAHTLAKDRTWLLMHSLKNLNQDQRDKFECLLSRREQREPVAYIVGHKAFFGLEFQVNRHVLIPRPETELLVETALEIAGRQIDKSANQQIGKLANWQINKPANQQITQISPLPAPRSPLPFSIVDVGTGSGCLAIALAKNIEQAAVVAIDFSLEALNLARQNAVKHRVAERISFLVGDLLNPLSRPVEMIVSNPPYVSRAELASAVSPEVARYEPRLALDAGSDGLDVIRQLLPQAKQKLGPGGSLLVEIGSTQGQVVTQLANCYFPKADIQVKKDLAGLDRLLVVKI
jgi:release factor glutamine methyltransferase